MRHLYEQVASFFQLQVLHYGHREIIISVGCSGQQETRGQTGVTRMAPFASTSIELDIAKLQPVTRPRRALGETSRVLRRDARNAPIMTWSARDRRLTLAAPHWPRPANDTAVLLTLEKKSKTQT